VPVRLVADAGAIDVATDAGGGEFESPPPHALATALMDNADQNRIAALFDITYSGS